MNGTKEISVSRANRKNWMKCTQIVLTWVGIVMFQQTMSADSLTYSQLLVFNDVPSQGTSIGQNYHVSGEYTYGMGWNLGSQFDTSLGHLDSMDWTVTLHSDLSSYFYYLQPPAVAGPGSVNETWSLQYLKISSLAGLDGKYLSATSGLPSVGNGLTVPVGGSVNGSLFLEASLTSHMTDPNLLNDFVVGTGFFVETVSLERFNTQFADGGPGLPDLQLGLSFTYNFTPAVVPEPSMVLLFPGAGLCFLGLRRFKGERSVKIDC